MALTFCPRRCVPRSWLSWALVLGWSTATPLAHADGPAAKAAAQSLFDEGSALLRGGEVAAACPKLEQSLALDRGMGTLLFLAECYERTGRSASAWAMFHEVAAEAGALGQTERATVASERAERLAPRVPRLTIQVPAAVAALVGLRVRRDGELVGVASFGSAIAVDPGRHHIEATAPGFAAFEEHASLDERDQRVVTLRLEPAAPPPPPRPSVEPPRESAAAATSVEPTETRSARPRAGAGTIALAASGATFAVVGGVFGLRAFARWDAARGHCDAQIRCDQLGLDRITQARTAATVSTIAWSAALVSLSVSGYLLHRDLRPSLRVGPGSVAVGGRF
jgi:hypothetical protein